MDKLQKVLVSGRGIPLMHQEVLSVPVITVENYEKWYSIYVIHPSGEINPISPGVCQKVMGDNLWWIDHRFHPKLLLALAKYYCGEVPDTTLEVVTGRWIIEGEYYEEFDYGGRDDVEEEPPTVVMVATKTTPANTVTPEASELFNTFIPAPDDAVEGLHVHRHCPEAWLGFEPLEIVKRITQGISLRKMPLATFVRLVNEKIDKNQDEEQRKTGYPTVAFWSASAEVLDLSSHWIITGNVMHPDDLTASRLPTPSINPLISKDVL